MMYNGGKFPFYEDQQLGVMMLALPYKNGAKGPVSFHKKYKHSM